MLMMGVFFSAIFDLLLMAAATNGSLHHPFFTPSDTCIRF